MGVEGSIVFDSHSGFKQFFIEPIYKVWFTIRNAVGDSKIELPIKPIMPER